MDFNTGVFTKWLVKVFKSCSPISSFSLKMRISCFLIRVYLFGLLASLSVAHLFSKSRPDVLFIVIDDLNNWISLLDQDAPIATPNLERLARRGMLFTRAYCASAACNPSRVATLTGLRPSSSGVYGNRSDWRRALPKRRTLMQHFKEGGYLVRGAGKIFHHHLGGAFHDKASFDDFQPMAPQNMPPKKLNGALRYGSRNTDWGVWPNKESDTIDSQTVDYCIQTLLETPKEQPLFLACGIFKPHSPFFAPPGYQEGLSKMPLPERKEDDWADLPTGAKRLMARTKWFWTGMQGVERKSPGAYAEFVRAYAACSRFADAQVGRLLDALDRSSRRDNTLIVLWSDHGFHLGEKDHIEKFALWEKSNNIPFVLVAPGITKAGGRCSASLDLTVIYPTLLELCGLPPESKCSGRSIVPLLKNPQVQWDYPAVMTYGRGNHAVRTRDWRYIRYSDGSEELYKHPEDPHEWYNLSGKLEYRSIIEAHRKWIPQNEVSPVQDLRR